MFVGDAMYICSLFFCVYRVEILLCLGRFSQRVFAILSRCGILWLPLLGREMG